MTKGFKCCDCKAYIVPPQIYSAIEINLCKCDQVQEASDPGVIPSKIDPKVSDYIMRLVALDEAQMPYTIPNVPILVSIPKRKREPFLERLAGVLSL